jgi:hypothetical protein
MPRYSQKAGEKVEQAMHERKEGTLRSGSGKKVTSKKQAIAIGLSEAREEGAKVPKKKNTGKKKDWCHSAIAVPYHPRLHLKTGRMKTIIILTVVLLCSHTPVAAQSLQKDSTALLYNQKPSKDSLRRQKRIADSLLRHKDTSWKRDNWVPDLDDKRKTKK